MTVWYDFFSLFYDRALEGLYREARSHAAEALRLHTDSFVLDVACGTGQNFDFLAPHVKEGCVLGVDQSRGMLARARRRIRKAGWSNIHLIRADVHALDGRHLQDGCGKPAADAVLCTLGLTAFQDWQEAFRRTFDLVRDGGRYVILDVHAEQRTFQTRSVEWIAQADLSRKVWEPLQAVTHDFALDYLPGSPSVYGGRLFVASGTKNRAVSRAA